MLFGRVLSDALDGDVEEGAGVAGEQVGHVTRLVVGDQADAVHRAAAEAAPLLTFG